jgi:outer membrane receptor for ferrienterochelin and colicins
MKKYIISFLLLLSFHVRAQVWEGSVSGALPDGTSEPLIGATLVWLSSGVGTVTDIDGRFHLETPGDSQPMVRVSYVGYLPDTFQFTGNPTAFASTLVLYPRNELKGVQVTGERNAVSIVTNGPINMEVLGEKELLKAPCCNLSESFETSVTVDAEFSDAVTGARTIRMLGLDGVYAMITSEGTPAVRGLSSGYGLTYIPGTWISSIQITKGTGSVVYGYEGITGAINAELQKPDAEGERLFLNLFGSNNGRWEVNLHARTQVGERLSTAFLAHTAQNHTPIDHNGDGFLDMPQNNTQIFLNRWAYTGKRGLQSQLSVKYVQQDLVGGQLDFNPDTDVTEQQAYGIQVQTNRWEATWKNGLVANRPNTSAGLIMSGIVHDQQSVYGRNVYKGQEYYFKADLLGQTYVMNTNHTVKAGASFLFNDFDESFREDIRQRQELVPGVFGEYHLNLNENFNLLAGFRSDFHNLYGTFLTPRLHMKYNVTPDATVRVSAGKAYRVANVWAENGSMLVSSRDFEIAPDLLPEEAWSYGATFIQRLPVFLRSSTITVDFYRTEFVEQVVVDRYSDPAAIQVYNLQGRSWSNASQLEWMLQPFLHLEMRIAYRYADVRSTFNGVERPVPMVSPHRGMLHLSYNWERKGWVFDLTTQYFGSAQLPNIEGYPDAEFFPERAPEYIMMMGQVTKRWDVLELYVGSENMTSYTQQNAILGASDPFGPLFDASVIYAPIMNRRFYGGIRLRIK